jgi:hypothetical protein
MPPSIARRARDAIASKWPDGTTTTDEPSGLFAVCGHLGIYGTCRFSLERRERLYRGDRSLADLTDQVVILADDGLATGKNRDDSVVKTGGIGRNESDVEDVTRDTYGFPSSTKPSPTVEERLERADRAAARAGIAGVALSDTASMEETGGTAKRTSAKVRHRK